MLNEIRTEKMKKAAIAVALDIRLSRIRRSPERCARNLIELGLGAYPGKLTTAQQELLLQELMMACRSKDMIKARDLFISSFLM